MIKYRHSAVLFFSIFMCAGSLPGQYNTETITGEATFVTSRNVYVKFDNTSSIEPGDTLHLVQGSEAFPCLVVNQKSSTSCVCNKLTDCVAKKGDTFLFTRTSEEKEETTSPFHSGNENELPVVSEVDTVASATHSEEKYGYKEKIRGRVSAATYSSLYSTREDRHRAMYRFSLNADHISDSRFSLNTYINYRQILGGDLSTQKSNFFRVYNLSARYDLDSTMSITLGRRIDPDASSLGAHDGIQVKKFFGRFFSGFLAGFRPDIHEYGLNTNLFQYGVYIGAKSDGHKAYSKTTLGLLEQRNGGSIDRRYVYFQHASTLLKKLNLFASMEMDLYKKVNEVQNSEPRLTSLFLSARYRLNRKVNLSVSFDTRKRTLFYETFKTDIERLLNDDEARQGIRGRINVRPLKYVTLGASYSKRFQNNGQNKSDNINSYFSLSIIPGIGGRFSFNFNQNTSNYLQSRIYSFRHSRSLIKKKMNVDLYFRNVSYTYVNTETQSIQNYYGAGLTYRFSRQWMFNALGEMAVKNTDTSYRFNTKLIWRFGK